MTNTAQEKYALYEEKMKKIADIKRAGDVLQWDQETYLPKKAATLRGRQLATLAEMAHHYFSENELGHLLQELSESDGLNKDQQRNVALTKEDYEKNKKYPAVFVRTLSEQINKTFHAWIKAREQNDFTVFEKDLQALIVLKKQEADILGYQTHAYNAHLNEYEKGCTVTFLDTTFDNILPFLKDLQSRIQQQPQVNDDFLRQHFPKQQQWNWGMDLLTILGFDFEAGRQDISEHPFTTSFGSTDVRLTTRIDEYDFANMTWSCIHEAGHGLYEQGLPVEQYGLPLGEYCSLGIHESQSRLWENNVGRSLAFWKYHFPKLQAYFPQQLGNISVDNFYKGINKITPGLIRTEADEITYHFHVYIRYLLEKALFSDELKAADIPAFWNSQYEKWLGVKVPDDRSGCLQDVHWSHGSFGYFPTYSLGSFYASQFFAAIQKTHPGLESDMGNGDNSKISRWLKQYVYPFGRKYTSGELCRHITGENLNMEHFKAHLLQKYGNIYNL